MEERLVSPQKQPEDEQGLNAPINLRPNSLADFVGQKQVCENLKVFIEAAKKTRRSAGSCTAVRSSGAGQNDAGVDCGERARGRFPGDFGADDFQIG